MRYRREHVIAVGNDLGDNDFQCRRGIESDSQSQFSVMLPSGVA
jgi:hypothetical protein